MSNVLECKEEKLALIWHQWANVSIR